MKHIKFQENIDEDSSYSTSKRTDNVEVKEFIEKMASNETKKWYTNLPEEPIDIKPLSDEEVITLKKEANSVLHGESLAYETKMNRGGSSDQKWARSLLSKGAMADRVAAATILIQDSPIHHLSTLRNLVSMVKPAKKKDSLTVMETLSELFLFDLLLPEAKLRPFENRPLSQLEKMCSGNRDHRRKILINWIFEDQLKEVYGEFIKCLNTFAHDTIEAHKEKAISTMSKLLMHNPEQEKVLLSNVINKLGDPSQKVASKVIYHLCQVLFNHPNMKKVVLDEIEKMLFRPNISPKAQYYGVCFLNQFYLSKDDNKVAENLVRVYFSFFKASIKKGDIDSRLMSAILTGVKRCQPFLGQQKLEEIQTQADALHRLVHLARYNISLHALALLFQISPLAKQLSDRYYCALYKKLGDPETLTTTLPALMMNLIYRSIKADKCKSRVLAFLKRLLQLAAISDAPRACAFLLLIARLARNQKIPMKWLEEPAIKDESSVIENAPENTIENEKTSENTEVNGSDDKNKKSKKKKSKKPIADIPIEKKSMWIGDKADLLDDDDEEVYHDVPLEEDEEDHKKKLKKIVTNKKTKSQGWLHLPNVKEEPSIKSEEGENDDSTPKVNNTEEEKKLKMLIKKTQNAEKIITEYDPFHRNPAYCGAEHSVFCELSELSNHFHPTVRLFAEKILNGSFVQYSGDPLIDFSIARFLDRFAFKNPKKDPATIGESTENDQQVKIIKGSHPKFAQRKNYLAGGLRSLPVNSSAYLNESYARIPVDERFLYDYLQTRKSATEENDDAESDTDSINSEDFNNYLDKLSGSKNTGDDSENEDEVDYMKDILSNKGKSKKVQGKNMEEGESDEDIEDAEASDDNIDDEEDSLVGEDDDNENLDDIDDEDEDSELDFSEEDVKTKKSKRGEIESDNESDINFSDDEDDTFDVPKKSKSKAKGKKGLESMFASAEEFAELLEETGTVKGQGTSQALSNSENAHGKQLDWETSRDRWVKGYNKKSKPNNGTDFEKKRFKGKPFKGAKNFNKTQNKRKFSEKNTFNAKRKRF